MANFKKWISWILLAIVVIAGLFVVRSIFASLKDTRAELDRQKAIADSLNRNDATMRAFVDSLNTVLAGLREQERQLAEERDSLDQALRQLHLRFAQTMARIDTLYEAGSIIHELDNDFPEWRGQIREATRADGVHALIVPRFFGANVVERMAELRNSLEELPIKDEIIANSDSTIRVKNQEVNVLTQQRDSLQTTYKILFGEYQDLDGRYRNLLKKKWFSVNLTPGNLLSAGLGAAGGATLGYLVGKGKND